MPVPPATPATPLAGQGVPTQPDGPPARPAAGQGTGPGFKATVAALALGQVLNWAVLYYAFSALVLPMEASLHWGRPTLMGAFTLGLAVCGACTYAMGAAIDAGRGRWVMTAGCALAALGVALWALVTQPWQLYAVWALLGLASAATLYEPAFAVLTQRYPQRFRQGITALTLVGGFASTLCYPVVAALGRAGLDWRQTLWLLAAVMAAMVPLHAWALRGPMLVAGPAADSAAADSTLHQALRRPAFWLFTGAFMLLSFNSAALWAHVMPAFADKGVSESDALWVLMAVGPAQVAGRLVYAWVGRAWSIRALGGWVLAAMPVALALFALGRSLAALLVFALVFGVANGLVTIVRGGLIPLYYGRAHVGRIGGVMSGVGQVARAAAPVLASAVLLLLPGYTGLLLILAGLAVLAAVAFWGAGPPPSS